MLECFIDALAGGEVVEEDGAVGVVVGNLMAIHGLWTRKEFDVGVAVKGVCVGFVDGFAVVEDGGKVFEALEAHEGGHFVHLRIGANVVTVGFGGDGEVFKVVDVFLPFGAFESQEAAFDAVEEFGGVEAEHGGVANVCNGVAIDLHAKGVGCIVDEAEVVFLRQGFEAVDVAGVPVDVDGNDGFCFLCDEFFGGFGSHAEGVGVDVCKDGGGANASEGMGGGNEGEGGGDDFRAGHVEAEGLVDDFKGKGAVDEEGEGFFWSVQEGGKRFLEGLEHGAVVGEPLVLPDGFEAFFIGFELGQEGACDEDGVFEVGHSAGPSWRV